MASDLLRRIAELNQIIERLEAQNRILRSALFPNAALPAKWGLTNSEEAIVLSLYTVGPDSYRNREQLEAILAERGHERRHYSVLGVRMVNIRRRLKPYGVRIDTVHARGFRLADAQSREIIRDALGASAKNLEDALLLGANQRIRDARSKLHEADAYLSKLVM